MSTWTTPFCKSKCVEWFTIWIILNVTISSTFVTNPHCESQQFVTLAIPPTMSQYLIFTLILFGVMSLTWIWIVRWALEASRGSAARISPPRTCKPEGEKRLYCTMWHPGHIQYPSNYILCQKHVCLSVCCHNSWVCFGPLVRNALYVHYVASIRSVVIFVSIFDMFHRRLGRYCILNLQKKTKQTIATEGTRETDRNPNLWYLPKPNILLNAKYSANFRIIGCRIVPI